MVQTIIVVSKTASGIGFENVDLKALKMKT